VPIEPGCFVPHTELMSTRTLERTSPRGVSWFFEDESFAGLVLEPVLRQDLEMRAQRPGTAPLSKSDVLATKSLRSSTGLPAGSVNAPAGILRPDPVLPRGRLYNTPMECIVREPYLTPKFC